MLSKETFEKVKEAKRKSLEAMKDLTYLDVLLTLVLIIEDIARGLHMTTEKVVQGIQTTVIALGKKN